MKHGFEGPSPAPFRVSSVFNPWLNPPFRARVDLSGAERRRTRMFFVSSVD
jgi:hypothetical protein